jgi:hypothetical protein
MVDKTTIKPLMEQINNYEQRSITKLIKIVTFELSFVVEDDVLESVFKEQ